MATNRPENFKSFTKSGSLPHQGFTRIDSPQVEINCDRCGTDCFCAIAGVQPESIQCRQIISQNRINLEAKLQS